MACRKSDSEHEWCGQPTKQVSELPQPTLNNSVHSKSHLYHSPVSITMQKDQIYTLKTLKYMSEFSGLWKHQNNTVCTKTVKVSVFNQKKKKRTPQHSGNSHIPMLTNPAPSVYIFNPFNHLFAFQVAPKPQKRPPPPEPITPKEARLLKLNERRTQEATFTGYDRDKTVSTSGSKIKG